jgi:hypothetical protein
MTKPFFFEIVRVLRLFVRVCCKRAFASSNEHAPHSYSSPSAILSAVHGERLVHAMQTALDLDLFLAR